LGDYVYGVHLRSTLQNVCGEFNRTRHVRFTVVNLLCGVFPDFASGHFRSRLYRLAGVDVHRGAFLMANIKLLGGVAHHTRNLHIADGVRIASGVVINSDADVHIEESVTIGPYVKIFTSTHELGPGSDRCDPENVSLPVVIERGSWVGLGATVLAGVTIGRGSVISAGAVVATDVPPNSLVQGVPGVVVQTLPFGDR
jgi:maltose O-acetyltransferase